MSRQAFEPHKLEHESVGRMAAAKSAIARPNSQRHRERRAPDLHGTGHHRSSAQDWRGLSYRLGWRVASVVYAAAALVAIPGPSVAAAQSAEAIAQHRYRQGVDFFRLDNFASATEEFRASLSAYDSPNTRFMLGRALHAQGQNAEAWLELSLARDLAASLANDSQRYARTARDANALAAELEPSLAWLHVSVEPAVEDVVVVVGGRERGMALLGADIPLDPGSHAVEVRARGFEHDVRTVQVSSGERYAVTFRLRPRAQEPQAFAAEPLEAARIGDLARAGIRARRTAIVSGIVSAASVIAFSTTGALTRRVHDDLSASCTSMGECDPGEISRGERLRTATNALIAVAGSAAIAVLISWIIARKQASAVEARSNGPVVVF